jgi:hypothetical protein
VSEFEACSSPGACRETNRLFPDKVNYAREPERWGLHKAPGSSNMSTQSVFLVLSKLSLVNGKCLIRSKIG